jgi:heme/copper-type cytochrome/quinol oxidase subunit 3
MATAPAGLPAAPAPPGGARPGPLTVATFLVIAAGVMLFGGLLGGYAAAREAAEDAGRAWPPEDVLLPNVPLAMAYVTLVMSSFTAQWAVSAIKANARTQLYVAVGLTLLLGGCFINAMTFCWRLLELEAGADPFATTVYAVTVTHVLVVVAAHVLFVVLGFRALGGQFSARNREFVDCAAAFWHFTVAAGAVIWTTIWFLEGGP